ncbi:hypothetical protein [Nocardia sp. NPDC051570]|uniref:hypothetical protein n=1 Tax=Nocardia sp. NPDC051570 TaxID=3364324 RepID=UPI0037BA2EFF
MLAVAAVLGVTASVVMNRDKSDSQADASASALAPATTTEPPVVPLAQPSERLRYTEYGNKNWDFTLGAATLHADWVGGRDYPDCRAIDQTGKLADRGCQYAAELVYRAEGGCLMLTQFILAMPDARAASEAVGQLTAADLKLRQGTFIDNFATSKWKDESHRQFVVITVATATMDLDEATATKYLGNRHSDTINALARR